MFNPTPDCNHSIENNPACEPTCDWPRNVNCGDRPIPGGDTPLSTTSEAPESTPDSDDTQTPSSTQAPPETTTSDDSDATTTKKPYPEPNPGL